MTNFVLVHGAWGGAWMFAQTAADLRAAGHTVLIAELTGLGNRRQEFHPGITLTTHIQDVISQTQAAGFDRFSLVGHSWGGMVITGVAAQLGAHIDAIFYIDAFLPEDGQSLWDLTSDWEHEHYIACQKSTPGAVAPFPFFDHPELTVHPLLTFLEAVYCTGEELKIPKKTYIFASNWQPSPFAQFANKVQNDLAWSYHALACGHDVMKDRPRQLLSILLGLK